MSISNTWDLLFSFVMLHYNVTHVKVVMRNLVEAVEEEAAPELGTSYSFTQISFSI